MGNKELIMNDQNQPLRERFMQFYRGAYREDHASPANLLCHSIGTLSGIVLLVASATIISPWWALLFLIVHAAPGLIGHRLFERNAALGDLRVFRGRYPGIWYMAANHLRFGQMLWALVTLRRLH
jgi:hypothetical protein